MTLPSQTKQWVLTNRPVDLPTTTGDTPTWTLQTHPLPELQPNQLLVKTTHLSNDPAQRGWMSARAAKDPSRFYAPPVQIGNPMSARGIATVLSSTSSDFKEGDAVIVQTNWSEHAVVDAKAAMKAAPLPGGLSMTHYLGALGSTGLTAYYGLLEIVRAKSTDVVVVSGAAGATGSMVVQIAKKLINCRKVVSLLDLRSSQW